MCHNFIWTDLLYDFEHPTVMFLCDDEFVNVLLLLHLLVCEALNNLQKQPIASKQQLYTYLLTYVINICYCY